MEGGNVSIAKDLPFSPYRREGVRRKVPGRIRSQKKGKGLAKMEKKERSRSQVLVAGSSYLKTRRKTGPQEGRGNPRDRKCRRPGTP